MFGRKKSSTSSAPSPSEPTRKGVATWRLRGSGQVNESSFNGSTREEALGQVGSGFVLPGENPHDIIEVIEVRDA